MRASAQETNNSVLIEHFPRRIVVISRLEYPLCLDGRPGR